MSKTHIARGAALLFLLSAPAFGADTPADYSHVIGLTVSGKNAVVQLRLPQAVYLNARSARLDDVRVFDAAGKLVPFALTEPATHGQALRRTLPVTIFPVPKALTTRTDAARDVEIKTSRDGAVVSIAMPRGDAPDGDRLDALVLDLGKGGQAIDALAFTLPAGVANYHAQVELEVSDDLRTWDALGFANLSWLVNAEGNALASNRMEFSPRAFRYARLSWHQGKPLLFGAIAAEASSGDEKAPAMESITIAPVPGKFKDDLMYPTPVAIPARRINLQFGERSVVLPGVLGQYVELPAVQGASATRWDFRPRLEATFFQLDQGGVQRKSGDIIVGEVHASNWVLRSNGLTQVQPTLRLGWTPATLVFMAATPGPYALSFGRARAEPAQLAIAQVAPGFSGAELEAVEQAVAGPLKVQSAPLQDDSAALAAAKAARMRMLMLWGVLLLGVAVLGFMAWKLIGQMKAGD